MKKQRTEEKKGIDNMKELYLSCCSVIKKIEVEEEFAKNVHIMNFRAEFYYYGGEKLTIRFIEQILPQFVNLKVLDASSYHIGDRGAIALATVLRKLPSLVNLNLWNNDLGPRGASALAPVLAEMSKINYLNIGSNEWGDDGISILAPALARMSSLKRFCMLKTPMTSRGQDALQSSLEKMRNLREIDIGGFFLFAQRASRFSRYHRRLLTRLNKALRVPCYPVAEAIWAISCGFRSSFRAPDKYDMPSPTLPEYLIDDCW